MLSALTRSSGTSTPVPTDAPPSVQATSSARKYVRSQQKRRMFPSIDFTSRVSHFDPKSDYHDFRGFFVLFWVGLAIMVGTTMLRNLKETGYLLSFRQWDLFAANLGELAISDAVMSASTALDLPLHLLFKNSKGALRWNHWGMVLQSIFQAFWLTFWVW